MLMLMLIGGAIGASGADAEGNTSVLMISIKKMTLMTFLVKSMSRNPNQAATSVITLRYLLVSQKFFLFQIMASYGFLREIILPYQHR